MSEEETVKLNARPLTLSSRKGKMITVLHANQVQAAYQASR